MPTPVEADILTPQRPSFRDHEAEEWVPFDPDDDDDDEQQSDVHGSLVSDVEVVRAGDDSMLASVRRVGAGGPDWYVATFSPERSVLRELYDHRKDQRERFNLAANAEHRTLIQDLRRWLPEHNAAIPPGSAGSGTPLYAEFER